MLRKKTEIFLITEETEEIRKESPVAELRGFPGKKREEELKKRGFPCILCCFWAMTGAIPF